MGSRALGVFALMLGLGATVPARAQAPRSDQDKALATTLFEEGRTLLAAGKVSEACRKLEESRRLDPLPGTVLNLAACHEQEGLTASAMAEFREARALAERDHRDDRVAYADEHIKALEPRLSTLVIAVGTAVDLPELGVKLDGVALGRAAWGTRIPVDPGTHVVEATAPNKQTRRVEVLVGKNADAQTATLAPLEDAPAPPPPPPVVAPPPPVTPVPLPEAPPPSAGLSTRRTLALASLGAGVVGIGLGSYFGLTAISKHNDPAGVCPQNATDCSAQKTLNDQAGFNADAATVSFAVALVAVGVGAFLWLGDTSVRVQAGVGSVQLSGRF
jgi:hypothetical protein